MALFVLFLFFYVHIFIYLFNKNSYFEDVDYDDFADDEVGEMVVVLSVCCLRLV